ncbi:MAG: hypothetical protein KGZ65_08985, partial [Sphingomonadales bacterium]|nr:hypothetical protein [Sphingomonadaceae bacterium]MBS3931357.1 hypothetical protein [Sphingomonadales bacterium]
SLRDMRFAETSGVGAMTRLPVIGRDVPATCGRVETGQMRRDSSFRLEQLFAQGVCDGESAQYGRSSFD